LKRNIIIYGANEEFRAAVGKCLGDRLEMLFCDTDRLIEYNVDMTIDDYLEYYTVEAFKRLETKIISMAAEYTDVVIAAGGHAFEDGQNIEIFAGCGVMVWLKADSMDEYANTDKIPPRQLFERREKAYRSCAEITVDVKDCRAPDKAADCVLKALAGYAETVHT